MTWKHLLLLASLAVLVCAGCLGWVRSGEYRPVHGKKVPLVEGWILEPDMSASKGYGEAETADWEFSHHFSFRRTLARGKELNDTFPVPVVDTMRIFLLGQDSMLVLPIWGKQVWVSYNDEEKELVYAASYSPWTIEGYPYTYPSPMPYPSGMDTVLLQMKVLVYPGVYHYKQHSHQDSLTLDRTNLLRDTVIEVRLRLRESKFPAVNWAQ